MVAGNITRSVILTVKTHDIIRFFFIAHVHAGRAKRQVPRHREIVDELARFGFVTDLGCTLR